MTLHLIDIIIISTVIIIIGIIAIVTRRYTRSVADYLSANRCAGRYLLTTTQGMAGMGAISIIAQWEQYYQAGFAALHWAQMLAPIGLLLALSGWVIYRYRETRAMTLAQFIEMRYSRRFRVFMGIMAFSSGILNYGIFPAVTARFFIYFFGLPVHYWTVPLLGLHLNITMGIVMAIMLGIAAIITLSGGQIAVMVTDFVQGQITNIVFIILLAFFLISFGWNNIITTLMTTPGGEALIHPFKQGKLPDFNPMFFVMIAFLSVYNYMVWQGSAASYTSAKSPHEAKMANILGQFRTGVTTLLLAIIPVCAYVVMHNPHYSTQAAAANHILNNLPDPQIAHQLTTTVVMTQVLPAGIMGLLAVVMIMASVTTDDTYLHSWANIFIQDVLIPIREIKGLKPIKPEAHLRLLRITVIGVALFAWCFSMLFPLREYILMYFQATGAIFTGGGGAVLIGGLYWSRGTTRGAWAGMITGATLAVSGVLTVNILWPKLLPLLKVNYPDLSWLQSLPENFWLNGVQVSCLAAFCASIAYIIGSLSSRHKALNMDRLLHRGKWRLRDQEGQKQEAPPRGLRALGFSPEFTRGDKIIYCAKLAWVGFYFAIFIIFTILNFIRPWSNEAWARWWLIDLWIIGIVGVIATVWFLIGGIYDMRNLFRTLSSLKRNLHDDGHVDVHLENIADKNKGSL